MVADAGDAQLRFLTADDVLRRGEEVVDVYRAAFRPPPYNKPEAAVSEFRRSLRQHVLEPGFRLVAAETSRGLVGFAYGRYCLPGQWWHDVVARPLLASGLGAWLDQSYNLVELAVQPSAQGHGLGSALHDRLLTSVPAAQALLSTLDAETVAGHLYRRRGWRVLLAGFHFPGVIRPYRIMGVPLPLRLADRPEAR